MSEKNENRIKWLHLRLSEKEHDKIPVTVKVRNQSLDDLMAEMILLRRELNDSTLCNIFQR